MTALTLKEVLTEIDRLIKFADEGCHQLTMSIANGKVVARIDGEVVLTETLTHRP